MEQRDRDTLIRLEERVRVLAEDLAELAALVNGPIRARMHKLENDSTAAKTATAAIEATRLMRDQMNERRFSRAEKVLGLGFGFVLAISSVISSALLIASHT